MRCLGGLLLVLAAALSPVASTATTVAPPGGKHAGLACAECHSAPGAAPAPCSGCHETAAHVHPSGRVAPFGVPSTFPLADGKIVCTTCHQIHPPIALYALRALPQQDPDSLKDFCVQCHGASLAARDPHRATAGTDRCAFCHAPIDQRAVLRGERPKVRAAADRVCDYCHDMRARNHPRNIDPVLDLPSGLPRGPRGEINCVTCHSPHGSSLFTHYVREEYAKHQERGREDNPHKDDRYACASCHVAKSAETLTAESHALRFQGDTIVLCISCHVRARSHHPVGIPLPTVMAERLAKEGGLPLDRDGRAVCTTCHTNNCESGAQHMSVRDYDPKRMNLSLCWKCHDKEQFAKTDPHQGAAAGDTEGCIFCHDRPPIKGLERAEDLYFVSQVKMICLRCHEKLSDQDVSHMGKTPTPRILERLNRYAKEHSTEFPLEKDKKFTCTTCHNAHFSAKGKKHRTRLPAREMCALCHER